MLHFPFQANIDKRYVKDTLKVFITFQNFASGFKPNKVGLKYEALNPSRPDPGRREKIELNFYFHTSCGAPKGFMKAFKVPQSSVKVKI